MNVTDAEYTKLKKDEARIDWLAYIKQLEEALQKLNNHWGVKESHKFTPHEHDLNVNAHKAMSSRPAILDGTIIDH